MANKKSQKSISNTGGFLMLRFKGTVILSVWWQVLLVIIYTVIIVLMELDVPILYMNFPTTLIDVLGVVTGLLLCFRTDSAYARYTEGREQWSTITNSIRKMTRGIWLGVREESALDLIEKRSALNLLIAFVVSTRHYLREEYSYDYKDIQDLINHLPKLATPSSISSLKKQNIKKIIERTKYSAHDFIAPTNIPLEITYYISNYFWSIKKRDMVDEDTFMELRDAVNSLVECLTAFERIQRTPIPLSYSVHLHHCVWLYILSLPYQMVAQLGWFTVPSVGLAAFSLLGILSIGWEIENPFGYDANDLPLDDFCDVISLEIDMITRSPMPSPDEWIYSENNHPLENNLLNAQQLSTKSLKEVHKLIRQGSVTSENVSDSDVQKSFENVEDDETEKLIKLVRKDHRL